MMLKECSGTYACKLDQMLELGVAGLLILVRHKIQVTLGKSHAKSIWRVFPKVDNSNGSHGILYLLQSFFFQFLEFLNVGNCCVLCVRVKQLDGRPVHTMIVP